MLIFGVWNGLRELLFETRTQLRNATTDCQFNRNMTNGLERKMVSEQ